jgi:protein-S-isoprenylcysteine O-methyltransferase
LGVVFGVHLSWLVLRWGYWGEVQWCAYALCLSCFHFAEFIVTAINQPGDVSYDSYLINHSRAYTVAAVSSWVEFWVEAKLTPGLKGSGFLTALGICMMVLGQVLRTDAMCTAGSNFTHLVALSRRSSHVLVDRGIYSLFRHPAYLGWFVWSVGTQVTLGNPLCTLAYALAAWSFFADRIPVEEAALLDMFGGRYARYARRTMIGIPFIHSPALLPEALARGEGEAGEEGEQGGVGEGRGVTTSEEGDTGTASSGRGK